MAESLLSQTPEVLPLLHPEFRPAVLGNRAFRAAVGSAGGAPLSLALERDSGKISVYETLVFPDGHPKAHANLGYVERVLKFLLWQKGAFKVSVAGSRVVAQHLAELYAAGGARA